MTHFKIGDRVRMAGFDVIEPSIPVGALGTVAETRNVITGKRSPYPDPARRLVLVEWDEPFHPRFLTVARICLEKISERSLRERLDLFANAGVIK